MNKLILVVLNLFWIFPIHAQLNDHEKFCLEREQKLKQSFQIKGGLRQRIERVKDSLTIEIKSKIQLRRAETIVRIEKKDGIWQGTHTDKINGLTKAVTPKSDWETFLQKLYEHGILYLPDNSILSNDDQCRCVKGSDAEECWGTMDGTTYSITILLDDRILRKYSYTNPDSRRWEDAQDMTNIVELIRYRLLYSGEVF